MIAIAKVKISNPLHKYILKFRLIVTAKNNGYPAFTPNTRYFVYQPCLTDAIIVNSGITFL